MNKKVVSLCSTSKRAVYRFGALGSPEIAIEPKQLFQFFNHTHSYVLWEMELDAKKTSGLTVLRDEDQISRMTCTAHRVEPFRVMYHSR